MRIKTFDLIGISAIFLLIISFAIMLTINFTPLYAWDIDYLSISERTGLSKAALLENYQVLLHYLNRPWVTALHLPDFPSSKSGLLHFYEVKRLFLLDYLIFAISGVISVFYVRFLKKTKRKWILIRPFGWGIAAPIVILFLMSAGFDRFFTQFHQLFFNNDAWLFDPAVDPVILALPETFFMHCFIFAFVLIEVLIIAVYFYSKKTAFRK